MDLLAMNLRSRGGGGGSGVGIGQCWGRPCWRRYLGGGRVDDGGFGGVLLEIKDFDGRKGRRLGRYRSLEVSATGKNKKKGNGNSSSSGSNDPSIPQRDSSEGSDSSFDKIKSDNYHFVNLDWRTFRANLVAKEQEPREDSDHGGDQAASHESSKMIHSKWAHPISMPETGCLLVATEKLDGVRNFERTVILLLRLGSRDPREGPFGVIINRPLLKKIKDMKPTNSDLATTFADCCLHFGGPLDASMFLIRTDGGSPLPGFEQVVSGISFGARNSLDEAAGLVKKGLLLPQDFRFFVGYAGWQLDQLREEIESDYWVVAACSSDLISCSLPDSSGLWEEILQLMGGQYSELSRKPRQDSS